MPAPQAIVYRPRVRKQVVELVAWAEDRLEEGSGHPLPAGVQRLQPCESEGFIVGQAWLDDAHSPSLDRLDAVGLLPSQPGVPHSAGVLHGTAHVRLVEGEEVGAGCACSPEHAHEVQPPVGVGTDVVDGCSQERSLEIMTPNTFTQLILSSLRPSIFSGGMSASGCFSGEGDNHLLGLVHVELHLVALVTCSFLLLLLSVQQIVVRVPA